MFAVLKALFSKPNFFFSFLSLAINVLANKFFGIIVNILEKILIAKNESSLPHSERVCFALIIHSKAFCDTL